MIVQPILDEAVMREMRKATMGDKDQQWAVARKNDVFCARKSGGSSRVDQRMQTCREAAEQWNQHIQRFITFNRYLPHGVKGMIGSVKRACRSSLQRLLLHKIGTAVGTTNGEFPVQRSEERGVGKECVSTGRS